MVTALPLLLHLPLALLPVRGRGGPWEKGEKEGGREKEKEKAGMKGIYEVEESEKLAEVLHSIPVATSFLFFTLYHALNKSLKM